MGYATYFHALAVSPIGSGESSNKEKSDYLKHILANNPHSIKALLLIPELRK